MATPQSYHRIRYRKHYATGSTQTSQRTIKAQNTPDALAQLERSIAARELNVRVSILAAYYQARNGEWIQVISNENDKPAPF